MSALVILDDIAGQYNSIGEALEAQENELSEASNSEQFVPIPGGLCDCRQAAPHVSSSQKIHIRKLY